MSKKPFKNRLALITGASRGLGRAIALELAKNGAHVIAVARQKKALEALDDEIRAIGAEATLVPLDITKLDGLDDLGLEIFKRWKKLDILVGNAGILGPMSPLTHVKPADWQKVMDVYLSANFRLIRSVDVLLRASDAGRALFITSNITKRNRAYWGPYAVAKAGLEALAGTYAAETAKSPIKVNLLNPGSMRTLMRAEAYPGEDQTTLADPEELAPDILKLLSADLEQTGQRFEIEDLKTL
ncbi:MAG: SDR family NAD(P)-dependent oxidoreductase [Sphingomonadales bacterium]